MASPPFNINETLPGDSDIVSQHPANARTFRDVTESWLLINHNVQGRHDEVQLDHKADPGAGVASVTEVWASSTGNAAGKLKMRRATGNVEYVGVFPGAVIWSARTADPEGYIICGGQAVSRSTFADLFDAIGTTFGAGDGSTTFNVPDIRGRVIAGEDDMNGSSANRLTGLAGGVDGDVFGATGGSESHTLVSGEIPPHTHTGTTTSNGAHTHTAPNPTGGAATAPGGGGRYLQEPVGTAPTSSDGAHTHTFTSDSTGGGGAHNNVQPTIILRAYIKT